MKIAQKIITICSSASHYKQALEIEMELKKLGFKVNIPSTARIMKRKNDYDVSHYKTWYKNKKDYAKKTRLMLAHFKKVIESDAILVTNYEKNGLQGYIGGNALMEMTLAFINKKPIFVLNPIDKNLNVKEEVYGLNSIFLNGNLNLIKKKLK